MKWIKYVESRLCVSSGLGKNMKLLSTILVYQFMQNTIVVTYITLFIYWQKSNVYGSKSCFYSCYFISLWQRWKKTLSIPMQCIWLKWKICMPVEMICLKAYFKLYFTTSYLQLQIINRFKYGKWKSIIRIGISIAHLRLGIWFIIICNQYS